MLPTLGRYGVLLNSVAVGDLHLGTLIIPPRRESASLTGLDCLHDHIYNWSLLLGSCHSMIITRPSVLFVVAWGAPSVSGVPSSGCCYFFGPACIPSTGLPFQLYQVHRNLTPRHGIRHNDRLSPEPRILSLSTSHTSSTSTPSPPAQRLRPHSHPPDDFAEAIHRYHGQRRV